ncbi:unnamed protein product [Adineta steineri]|uniref:Uncharacterized protein n=1 Tax=Adineta steineri TaxID=433720 RepID=A0A813NAZ7_9BILA|nr:unnamed protein product [Adineta steineri]CAF0738247.1 unnamed protein product [Adineta steineri]CAF0748029.1 unnamed protein product [Adineta steineri]
MEVFEDILASLLNVYLLSFQSNNLYIDGNNWEESVRTYLPKLKIFQMKTTFHAYNNKDKESQLNELIDPYRKKFRINEHEWFVQAVWFSSNNNFEYKSINIFTLPFSFSEFPAKDICVSTKSAYPYENFEQCFQLFPVLIDFNQLRKRFIQLIRSSLITQCQTLLIKVKNQKNILDLINSMPNLKSLTVECLDDRRIDRNLLGSHSNDELVDWLR